MNIRNSADNIAWMAYLEDVMGYLEYLGYPEYVAGFQEQDVARSLSRAASRLFDAGMSYRFTALFCFGATWELQIVRAAKEGTKH